MNTLLEIAHAVPPRKPLREKITQERIPIEALDVLQNCVLLTPEQHEEITRDTMLATDPIDRLTALCQHVHVDAITFSEFLQAVDCMGMGRSWDIRYLTRRYRAA